MIDHLPRDTFYREAVALDVEMAEAYMQSEDYDPDDQSDARPQQSSFSAEVEALYDIGNQLRALRMGQISAAGGTAPKIPMLRGPKTAMEAAEFNHRLKDHLTLSARLLPHKRDEYLARVEQI